jgi:hypothetical protein
MKSKEENDERRVWPMVRRNLLIWLVITAMTLTIAITACAPKAETPSGGESSQLFFKPLTYTNEELGFSIKYPDTYMEIKPRETGDIFFYAAGPLGNHQIPVLFIRKLDAQETDQQKIENVKSVPGSSDVSVTYVSDITLADGKTTGKIYLYVWTFMQNLPMRNLELVVTKGDYAIGASMMSTEMMYNKKRYLDILRTFSLN